MLKMMTIQEGNTKDAETVHALEMGLERVQLLNSLNLTKKKTAQELLGKKSDYTSAKSVVKY